MCNDAGVVKEAGLADAFGAIDNLTWDDEIARTDLFPQRADSGEGEDRFYSEVFKSGDVCGKWDGGGLVGVMGAMAGNECNLFACRKSTDRYWR